MEPSRVPSPPSSQRPAVRRWAAAVGALAVAIACRGATSSAADDPPHSQQVDVNGNAVLPSGARSIRGTVTLVQNGDSVARDAGAGGGNPNATTSCPPNCAPGGPPLRAVMVEEKPGPLASGGAKSMVKVLSTARVLRRSGGRLATIGFADLTVGQQVEVWFSGPVLESYPSQATAGTVLVVAP